MSPVARNSCPGSPAAIPETMTAMPLDIEQVIDGARLGPLHWRVLILCALVTLLDGYDIQAMASITPSLAADWHVPPGELRWIITAALIGIAGSALIVSPLGDYLGRRGVLLASFAVVGVATLMAATAHTPNQLFAWRLLTGIGLGASLPNALALTAEFAPTRNRTMLVALMACGISLGAATSGFLAPEVIEFGGWRAVFVTGGVLAVLALLPLFALPESLRFLVARRRDPMAIGKLLQRLDRNYSHSDGNAYVMREQPAGKLSVGELLTPQLAPATLLLWMVFFLNLGLLYLLSSWLPTLLKESGLPLTISLRIAAMFQIGGVVGGFALAWLMQRWGPYIVLSISYALTAAALAVVGAQAPEPALTTLLIAIMGNGVVGGQVALNVLSATLYPTTARATGVGWALGMGRFGGIIAPLAAGQLMAAGIAIGHLFWLAIVPALICAGGVALLRAAVHRSQATPASQSTAG
jgi:AAHS family 4-hydroxybenzoate transporter-like MFS transporter